jgi:hypothetical protein
MRRARGRYRSREMPQDAEVDLIPEPRFWIDGAPMPRRIRVGLTGALAELLLSDDDYRGTPST